MNVFSTAGLVVLVLASMSACTTLRSNDAALTDAEMPSDIRVRLTDEGLVFTDARGKTLYWSNLDSANPGTSHCTETYSAPAATDHPVLQIYYQEYKDKAPSCTSQWPPVLASSGARPVENWSIVTRADGKKQWAYNDLPVYTSYKDRMPGDVNGVLGNRLGSADTDVALPGLLYYWSIAKAPMKLPPGVVAFTRNDLGVIAATLQGPLYTRNPQSSSSTTGAAGAGEHCVDCPAAWRPFEAGAAATAIGNWTIRDEASGHRTWMYLGAQVYTFKGDSFPEHLNGVAGGSPVLLVKPAYTPPPTAIQTRFTGLGEVFTNPAGKTLYAFYCTMRVPGASLAVTHKFTCSGWSDDVSQREQLCAAPDRCAERWVPAVAPPNEPAHAGTWSVAVIPDPVRFPLRWVPVDHPSAKTQGALKVWTHRGRPLYTFTEDKFPLEFRGHHIFLNSGQRWSAVMAGNNFGSP